MSTLSRVWRVAACDLKAALRSRRALVVTFLFMVVLATLLWGLTAFFALLEEQVVAALRLPEADTAGAVTMTLWRSNVFRQMVRSIMGNDLVFADVCDCHPVVLAFALVVFQIVPMLTLLVSSSRLADEIRSGTARFWLVRVSRGEWALGKFLGEALLVGVALLAGACAAGAVAAIRLPGGAALMPSVFAWTLRAWVCAFAWLGLFCGLSLFAGSGGKATALGILALVVAGVAPTLLEHFAARSSAWSALSHFAVLFPGGSSSALWRSAPAALASGVCHFAALGFAYLAVGAAHLGRRDL